MFLKKQSIIIILMFIFITSSITFASSEIENAKINNVVLMYNEANQSMTVKGTTSGMAEKMSLFTKVVNNAGEIIYFDHVYVENSSFSFTFKSQNIVEGEKLILKIGGDLLYNREFIFSKDTETGQSFTDKEMKEINNLIENNYLIYEDYEGVINFKQKITDLSDNELLIKLVADVSKESNIWNSKNNERFGYFLEDLTNDVFKIANKSIKVYVYDNNKDKIDEFMYMLSEDVSADKILEINNVLNSENSSFDNFNFNIQAELKDYYIKIKLNGRNFLLEDKYWSELNENDLIEYLDNVSKKVFDIIKKDVSFFIYDKENNFFNSYDYLNSNTIVNKTEEDKYNDLVKDKNTEAQNILNVVTYTDNSKIVNENNLSKNKDDNFMKLVFEDVNFAKESLNDLRNSKKKELIVKTNDTVENKNIKINNRIVKNIREEDALLTIATNRLISTIDINDVDKSIFSRLNALEYGINLNIKEENSKEININEVSKETISKIIDIELTADSMGNETSLYPYINNSEFKLIYTVSESLKIKDLRTLNVYKYNEGKRKWEMIPTKLNLENHALIFNFKGNGKYTIVSNDKDFEDIDGYWGESEIRLLSSKDLINGKVENKFVPTDTITRAEFITLAVRKLGLPLSSNSDLKDINGQWFSNYAHTAKLNDILPPTMDNVFAGNTEINREEMAYITYKMYEINKNNKEMTPSALFFEDTSNISQWARQNISKITELKIVQGWNNSFHPKDTATRGQAAKILFNLMSVEGIF